MPFEPEGLGRTIFTERYARDEGETWTEAAERVGGAVAAAEDDPSEWTDKFAAEIADGRFAPGGRIMYGAGRSLQSLLNCFVIPVEDSREAWGRSLSDLCIISGMGGGVGTNFSQVRGRDYPIRRMGGTSTGAVSLMSIHNAVGDHLEGGGSRRSAMMHCLNVDHPDINEFINSKQVDKAHSNANISVVIPPSMPTGDFVDFVQRGKEIELRFSGLRIPDEVVKNRGSKATYNATEMWDKLVAGAWQNGEPGVLNGYLANKESNVYYAHPLVSTNPCGEIWLPAYGCCCLGAVVLPRFVSGGRLNYQALAETVRLGVRFLDNVLTVNHYPLNAIQEMCFNERRIGLGVMGLHSMFLDLGMKYSEGYEFANNLFRFIKETAYEASIELAKEKGPFALYDERFLGSNFMRRQKRSIRAGVLNHGIRNCALLTIAPTGTTSMVQGVTSGIEPMFSPVFVRRRKVRGQKYAETLVISKDYADHPGLCEGAYDLTPAQHFEMQKVAQHHIDNAVSKTINLPHDFPQDQLSDVWLEYLPHLKGSTFYREGSRGEEPLKHVPHYDSAVTIMNWDGEIDNAGNFSVDACKNGECDV